MISAMQSSGFLKFILFVVGALCGLGACYVLAPNNGSNGPCSDHKQAGSELTFIGPQASNVRHDQPPIMLKSSKIMFKDMPLELAHTYYMPCGKNCHATQRAFRTMKWIKSNQMNTSLAIHTDFPKGFAKGFQTFQRYNHIYNRSAFSRRDNFLSGIAAYKNSGSPRSTYFVPESYRMHKPEEKKAFEFLLKSNKAGKFPWILHKGGNKWIEDQLVPLHRSQSVLKQITSSDDKSPQSLQLDICNQLPYNDGQPMIVRVMWLVASTDPLIVLYQDGYGRVGYNETYPQYNKHDDYKISFEKIETYLWGHWKQSRSLRKSINDPVVHVRNQFKESIATIVDAFKDQTFKTHPDSEAEDGYEAFAADFVIDTDLDVWMKNLLTDSPRAEVHYSFMTEDHYFLLAKNHELWTGMVQVLDEIWHKQAVGANILPLQKHGKWQLIVAGDEWSFDYSDYERPNKRKACNKKKRTKVKKIRKPSLDPEDYADGDSVMLSEA